MENNVTYLKLVENENDREKAFELRDRIFIQENGMPLSSSDKSIWHKDEDDYDEAALHFLFIKDEEAIGVMRLIPISTPTWNFRGLYEIPTDCKFFNFDFSRAIEISRVGILNGLRNIRYLSAFLKTAAIYARQEGKDYIVGTMRVELFEVVRRFGVELAFKSEPFDYHNKWKIVAFICAVSEDKKLVE
jgi:N-acyl-L-homoserine lactone synthetase